MARTNGFTQGFTLVEVMVVIAILLILAAISVEGYAAFATRSGAETSARIVEGVLEEARARTLAAMDDTAYGVHFDANSVTLFSGATYVSGDPNNDVRRLSRASLSNISLSGGVSDVVFSRLRGAPMATGTITVTQAVDASLFRTVTIHTSGLIEISN